MPFLPSFPSFENDEKLEESLGGFPPPIPPIKECLLDCIIDGVSWLGPHEVDCCKSPFCLLLGLIVLKFALSIVVAS